MQSCRTRFWAASLAGWCLLVGAARADFVSDFEAPLYTGSAAGTALTGQQGWYVPVAGSAPYNVLTYPGNVLGLPANPNGGNQFIGVASPGTSFARAQIDTAFTGMPVWIVGYDVAHRFSGTLPATQNLASVSTQNPSAATTQQVIALHTWTDVNTAANWNAGFNVFDSAGVSQGTQSPGAAWNNLLLDNWYHESLTFNLLTNQVLSVSLTDVATGVTNTFNPTTWYMPGGAAGGFPAPTALRFFGGGTTAGNVAGWDNLSIQGVPEPSTLLLMGAGMMGVFGAGRRRKSLRGKS